MNARIWLSSPHMGGKEADYVKEAFDSNWIAPIGDNINRFEQQLENYLGTNAGALNSGTAAIHLGLILLGVSKGDEVLVQTHTHVASVNPVVYLGATPVFIDSEPDTWNICPKTLEAAIEDRIAKGKKPKAIIGVHLYGMPFKIDDVVAIAKKYNIALLEDAAEALGSSYKGQLCGTFGDIGALSFNGNKIITTSGGGALLSADIDTKHKAIFLSTQARDKAAHYQHSEIGYNYRLSNICAGIGCGQMEVLATRIEQRRNLHLRYSEYFKNIEGVDVLVEPNDHYFSNHWLTAILIDPDKSQGRTSEGLRLVLEAHNIESRPLWKPMHLQPVFAGCDYYGGEFSQGLFLRGLCLPSGSNTNNEDFDRITAVFDGYFVKNQ